MIHVIATITALPGERDAMPALFRKSQPDVLAENECVSYEAVFESYRTSGRFEHRLAMTHCRNGPRGKRGSVEGACGL